MFSLSLDHLTVFESPAPEIVGIAADLGFDAISLFIHKPNDQVEVPPLIADLGLRRQTADLLRSTGVRLNAVECFILSAGDAIDDFRPAMEVGAELGGRVATAVVFGEAGPELTLTYRQFCRAAAEYGLAVDLEYLAFSPINSLAKAAHFLAEVDEPNAGLLVDVLHLVRTGDNPARLAGLPAGLVRGAQICDGPLAMPPERQAFEGLEQRQIPGAGEFPLVEFLSALPPNIHLGVEVPLRDLRERGVPPRDRAAQALAATRRLLGAAV